jgi:hypothetical protein
MSKKMKTSLLPQMLFFVMISISYSLHGQTVPSPVMNMSESEYKIFLSQFTNYPEKALQNGEEGDVQIDFFCDKNGHVTERLVTKNVSQSIDSAALALFDLIVWKPLPTNAPYVMSKGSLTFGFNSKKFRKLAKQRGYILTPPLNQPADTSGKIYTVEKTKIPPKFIKTDDNPTLADYINNELKYPEAAKKLGLAGTVTLSFVIELNGKPSNIHAESYVGGGCTEEAIRLISALKWTPAIVNDKYVRTFNQLNITFEKGRNNAIYIPNQNNTGI